jgi:hypothetical protein
VKQVAHPTTANSQHTAGRAQNRAQSAFLTPQSQPLAQLASMMNQSPRVQAQLKLANEIQNGESVQKQRILASEINQGKSNEPGVHDDDSRSPKEPPVAQLYQDVTEGGPTGYGKGAGVNAPTFEFQKFAATRDYDDTTSTATYAVDANRLVENAPNLRVSNNNDLAVPTSNQAEAKRLFAAPAKVQESNRLLHDSGSPLRLIQGAGQVNLPAGGPTLHEVTPDLTQLVNDSSECGAFARNILGSRPDTGEITINLAPRAVPGVGNPMGGRPDATLNVPLAGQPPEQLGANENADPEVGEAFGIYAKNVATVGDRVRQCLAYLKWGEHWAGVVAKSGGDYVTLENYNRNVTARAIVEQAVERDYSELRGISDIGTYKQRTAAYAKQGNESRWQRLKRLGSNYMKYAVETGQVAGHFANDTDNWYFAMYGSGAQSFHEAWQNALPNSVTLKTHSSDQGLHTQLVAQLRALVPADNYAPGTQASLNAQILRIQAAAGRPAIIAAFLAAEKRVCNARLASARTFLRPLRPTRPRKKALHRACEAAMANVNAATGDAVKQACITGIHNMQAT